MSLRLISTFCLILFYSSTAFSAYKQYLYPYSQPSFSDYGTLGLIQMPNSRFHKGGTLGFAWSRNQPYMRGGIVAYPFDWFEIIYKYTDLNDQLYSSSKAFSGGQSLKDKGFDIKLKLLSESNFLPSVSFGFRDFGGTNRFQSEYIVASKMIDNFDVTFGIGWGVMSGGPLSSKNPFRYLAESFNSRTPGSGLGGQFAIKSWLRGKDIGFFGGIEWYLPNAKGHRIKVEIDANNYTDKSIPLEGKRPLEQKYKINLGYTIPYSKSLQFNFGFIRGNTFQFGFSYAHNYGSKNSFIKKTDNPKIVSNASTIRRLNSNNDTFLYRTSLRDLASESIYLQYAERDSKNYEVVYSQPKFYHSLQALGRAARILDQIAPEDISTFKLTEINGPFENYTAIIDRSSFRQNMLLEDYQSALRDIEFLQQSSTKREYAFQPTAKYPIFNYGIGPALRSHIGGPDGFALGQLWLRSDASVFFNRNHSITGTLGIGIYDNFDELKLPSDSVLPHVRTEIVNYLKGGRNWNITRLQYDNIRKPFSNIYFRFSAGLFEEMFGGIGGEILYRPLYSNFAIGADLYRVKQRDFNGEFEFLDYQTTTGHLTFYFEEPNTGILFRLIGGRYLAKDSGITIDFSRRFNSGLSMGVFASKTDISAEEFGEGSFDKGFYFSLPIDLFFQNHSKGVTGYGMRPITRDGAAKLITSFDLWGVSNSASINTLDRSREYFYD